MKTKNPIKIPYQISSELFRSATRCKEQVIKLSGRTIYDGTKCVLIPEVLFNRLEKSIAVCEEFAVDWRE